MRKNRIRPRDPQVMRKKRWTCASQACQEDEHVLENMQYDCVHGLS